MRYIPIQSYAAASSKSDVIRNYMLLKVEKDSVADTLSLFVKIMDKLFTIRNELVSMGSFIADNNLFFEVMYWVCPKTFKYLIVVHTNTLKQCL